MQKKGVLTAAAAYIMWGFFPIYWKQISEVPAIEILAHRMTWSLVFLLGVLTFKKRWDWIRPSLRDRRIIITFIASACLLSINWFTYIWGVNAGHVVETSLGYFINPLINVLLGAIFLGERLRRGQWPAIVLAAIGVTYLTISYGELPWIALTLAFSFGFYGLLRKTASLGSLEGQSLETAILFIPAFLFLLYRELTGVGSFGHAGWQTTALLAFAGVATAVPLLLFATGARQITLTTLGLLQYIAPTIQFLIGVLVYNEDFSPARMVGFSIIWLGLIIYTAENFHYTRRRHAKFKTVT